MKIPELLAPAGDMEKLKAAVLYGANAVYLAGDEFGMRAASKNFGSDGIREAVDFCHTNGVKAYITVNTMPRDFEIPRLEIFLQRLSEIHPDALIIADLGALALAKKHAPNIDIHISTQASIVNSEAAKMWYYLGAKRVILARELSLSEIVEIREKTPDDLELETFVHGAMCVSYSGRCLLSAALLGRDANRGRCAQPCRFSYALVEEKRPGRYYGIEQDTNGTYILNSEDLCMVDHIDELCEAEISSLKIEGRAKSDYYAASVTAAYRAALDAFREGTYGASDPFWSREVLRTSHRPFCTGFYYGEAGQNQTTSNYIREWEVVGRVIECADDGEAVVEMKNRFGTGECLELLTPRAPYQTFITGELRNEADELIAEAIHPCMLVKMKLPCKAVAGSYLRKENMKG